MYCVTNGKKGLVLEEASLAVIYPFRVLNAETGEVERVAALEICDEAAGSVPVIVLLSREEVHKLRELFTSLVDDVILDADYTAVYRLRGRRLYRRWVP